MSTVSNAVSNPASIFPTQQLNTSTIANAVSNPASIFSPNQVSTTSSSSSSSSSSVAQAAGTNASQQLAGNFNTFLQLLTTQLQNQNPLDPLDTNQFTQQLVEFASVEQ